MTRREALFVAHRIPYPPDKGDKIRSWRVLEALCAKFDTHLAAFVDDAADFAHADFLAARCASVTLRPLRPAHARARSAVAFLTGEPLTLRYYRDGAMARAIARLRERPLAIEVAFSSSVARYIEAKVGDRPRIVDLCDADSMKWRDFAQSKGWPMNGVYARESRTLANEEARIINWADAAFAISEEEALLLGEHECVRREVDWFGNGVDTEYFRQGAAARAQSAFDVLFVGAMDYWANVDAVTWFASEIWPAVRARQPAATFGVVGSNPTRAVAALDGANGIGVTGRVADVRPYLAAAKVSVAPMRIARGVQNKVLEAMAFGLPVVSTPAGLQGISAIAGTEAISVASAASFADEVDWLIDHPAEAARIGAAARARVISDYQWPAQLARLNAAIDRLAG